MEKLLKDCPYYASYTIPAGTYDGLDVDTQTVTVKATLICSANLTDDGSTNGSISDFATGKKGIVVGSYNTSSNYGANDGIDNSADFAARGWKVRPVVNLK